MAKKNLRLKLYNNLQVYTNIAIQDNNDKGEIYRFLDSLRRANNIDEQLFVINETTPYRGYSRLADEIYDYDVDKDCVKVMECSFDIQQMTYRKGRVSHTIYWDNDKIRIDDK